METALMPVPVQHVRALAVRPADVPDLVWREIDREIDAATEEAIQAGVPANTRRAYARWNDEFDHWCKLRGRHPLPATPETLATFIAWVKDSGRGVSALRQAIAAIRSNHALCGYPEQPPAHLARIIARGHQRALAAQGVRVQQAPPILRDDLHAMIDVCDPDSFRGHHDRLVLAVGFGGLLRRSELVGLHVRDVTLPRPPADGAELFIAASKTDKQSVGVHVSVDPAPDLRSDVATALVAYRVARTTAGLDADGTLFRHIGTGGKIGGPMTGDAVNDLVKELAAKAGLVEPNLYSAHSLRAGGATQMYLDGYLLDEIIERGRWAPGSTVVLGYIRSVSKARRAQMHSRPGR